MCAVIPSWIYTVKVKPEFAEDKFDSFSDGIHRVSTNTVVRFRTGHFDTDAARWSRGFTSGKHVFEIVYPNNQRGTEAPVGVGLESAPLWVKGRSCLIGSTADSWGICLRSKRAFHCGKVQKKYPLHQRPLPDTFYMYLDADSGNVMFGSNVEFYGSAIANISARPLYPMIGSCMQGSTMTMIYRGEGDINAIPPEQPVYGQHLPAVPAAVYQVQQVTEVY
ncbi:SPRY domain-containing SOCS box protein 1-like [Gigantopelta aegis]|uniref:SPRY domain-containing SOCS box protein 1-like n=1 Tax=Gigantopelta aegis TaxID=1735272 RepID=UPI001B88E294|nr:SPRY domain-containing SOCS box protein 1-like [Gigantopelta aegis]